MRLDGFSCWAEYGAGWQAIPCVQRNEPLCFGVPVQLRRKAAILVTRSRNKIVEPDDLNRLVVKTDDSLHKVAEARKIVIVHAEKRPVWSGPSGLANDWKLIEFIARKQPQFITPLGRQVAMAILMDCQHVRRRHAEAEPESRTSARKRQGRRQLISGRRLFRDDVCLRP